MRSRHTRCSPSQHRLSNLAQLCQTLVRVLFYLRRVRRMFTDADVGFHFGFSARRSNRYPVSVGVGEVQKILSRNSTDRYIFAVTKFYLLFKIAQRRDLMTQKFYWRVLP